MNKKAKPPRVKKAKPFSLKSSTCAQLLEWIESAPSKNEGAKDKAQRRIFFGERSSGGTADAGLRFAERRSRRLTTRALFALDLQKNTE